MTKKSVKTVTNTKASKRLKQRARAVDENAEQILVSDDPATNDNVVGDVGPANDAPPIINDYDQIYHFMRTIGAAPNPQAGILNGAQLDAEVSSIMDSGFQIVDVLPAGYSPEGDRLMFIFGKPVAGGPKYSEMHFIRRTMGVTEGAVTGFQADTWLNHMIEVEGWRVRKTVLNGTPPEGIIIIWILVR